MTKKNYRNSGIPEKHRGKFGDFMIKSAFFKGKNVLLTGHTGFKGSWMSVLLNEMGAKVHGYSLEPPTEENLFDIAKLKNITNSKIGDIRDLKSLKEFYDDVNPDIVIHMAAQPLVIDSYNDPRYTYETNVMGTVNILECLRLNDSAISFLNVTTDKVYDNIETDKYYKESDPLDGFDPYSNSKSCSELVTHSYKRSFFDNKCPISTARAGNVIGGGDFATNRIVPDCVRAVMSGKPIEVRNPNSIRPYQHVLEPLHAYLKIIESQAENPELAGSYNIGPRKEDCVTTGVLADTFCKTWGNNATWKTNNVDGPHEANFLKLDSTLVKEKIGFEPVWHIDEAISKTVEWTRVWIAGENIIEIMKKQISDYGGIA